MKFVLVLAVFTVLGAVPWIAGCSQQDTDSTDTVANTDKNMASDAWMVNNNLDTAIRDGIITEHTLYPYDFVDDSGELNPLGLRDLGVLADHFKDTPGGVISVFRGDATQDIYSLRVQAVEDALVAYGLPRDHVAIVNQMAAGEGMPSGDVLKILALPTTPYLTNVGGTGSSSSGSSSGGTGSSGAMGGSQY